MQFYRHRTSSIQAARRVQDDPSALPAGSERRVRLKSRHAEDRRDGMRLTTTMPIKPIRVARSGRSMPYCFKPAMASRIEVMTRNAMTITWDFGESRSDGAAGGVSSIGETPSGKKQECKHRGHWTHEST